MIINRICLKKKSSSLSENLTSSVHILVVSDSIADKRLMISSAIPLLTRSHDGKATIPARINAAMSFLILKLTAQY